MTISTVLAKTTSTAAATGGTQLDISGVTGDWTLVLEVLAMNDGNACRFGFQDSVDAFTNNLAGPTISLSGKLTSSAPRRFTVTKKDFPNLRCGVASAVLRLNLLEITGSSKSVTYQAWLES